MKNKYKIIKARVTSLSLALLLVSSLKPLVVYSANNTNNYNIESTNTSDYEKLASILNIDVSDITQDVLDSTYYLPSIDSKDIEYLKYFKNLKYIFIDIDNNIDFNKINNLSNLNALYLNIYDNNINIDFSNLNNNSLNKLCINNFSDRQYNLSINDLSNISKSNITDLEVSGITFEPGAEEYLNKLSYLCINTDANMDIDFTKLTNIKELDLSYNRPYSLPVFFNTNENNILKSNGVKIDYPNSNEEEYINISNSIDNMLNDIKNKYHINENSSDIDKIKAITSYIINNYTYDESISSISDSDYKDKLVSDYYKDGYLYAPLNNKRIGDNNEVPIICGNYAALVEAFMDRLSVPKYSYLAKSESHAWNIIDIDSKSYILDLTWIDSSDNKYKDSNYKPEEFTKETINGTSYYKSLTTGIEYNEEEYLEENKKNLEDSVLDIDQILETGNYDTLNYFLISMSNVLKMDKETNANGTHDFENDPGYLDIYSSVNYEDENNLDYKELEEKKDNKENKLLDSKDNNIELDSNTKIKIKINNKVLIITLGALIGILVGLGALKHTNTRTKRIYKNTQRYINKSNKHHR